MIDRLGSLGDLAVMAAIAVLAGVGTAHEARKAQLEARLRDAEARATTAEAAVEDLSEAAIALRDRTDRSATSLAFLSDVAKRMDDPDPQGAGQAALDLAIARTGARGGLVQLLEGGRLRTLTARGPWSAEHLAPPALFRDRVAVAAIDRAKPVAAHEVAQVSADDSDLAAPLLAEDGTVIGVLSLRGIAFPALTAAAREDLAAVARWAGRSFARTPRRGAGPAAVTAQGRGRAAT